MTGEKLLSLIERYICLDLIIMLAGLMHSSDEGLRGFPFAWLGGERTDVWAFLMSLAAVTAGVFVCNIISAMVIAKTEPVSSVQKTIDKYSSSFSQYETKEPVQVRQAGPSVRNNKKTVELKPLLNGAKSVIPAKAGNDGKKKTPNSLVAMIAIITSVLIMVNILSEINDIGYDDSWDSNTELEDVDYDSIVADVCETSLTDLSTGDTGWIDDLDPRDEDAADQIYKMADWENSAWDMIYLCYNGNDRYNEVVCRYRIHDGEKYYLAAFKVNEDEEAVTGFAICPYPSCDEYGDNGFGESSYDDYYMTVLDDSEDDDESYEKYETEVLKSQVAAGSSYQDDVSILLW